VPPKIIDRGPSAEVAYLLHAIDDKMDDGDRLGEEEDKHENG
jgi:hypothetical protein